MPYEIPTREKGDTLPDEQKKLEEFIQAFRNNQNAISLVVSNPFKPQVLRFCDETTALAEQIRVVNLILKRDNKLIGTNIDGDAFYTGQIKTINYDFSRKSILLRTVGFLLQWPLNWPRPILVQYLDPATERVNDLSNKLTYNFPELPVSEIKNIDRNTAKIDIIYNGTGVGKRSDNDSSILESPLPNDLTNS